MNADCGCCGISFESEGEEKTCSSCGGCTVNCMVNPESPPTPEIIPSFQTQGECHSFSELEQNLFDGQEGQKTLARILTRMRVEGYHEDGWKVMIGLTAFAYKYYNCKGIPISEQLKMLENAPLREVTQYMTGDVEKLTVEVMNAESLHPHDRKERGSEERDAFKILGLALTALAFAYATRG